MHDDANTPTDAHEPGDRAAPEKPLTLAARHAAGTERTARTARYWRRFTAAVEVQYQLLPLHLDALRWVHLAWSRGHDAERRDEARPALKVLGQVMRSAATRRGLVKLRQPADPHSFRRLGRRELALAVAAIVQHLRQHAGEYEADGLASGMDDAGLERFAVAAASNASAASGLWRRILRGTRRDERRQFQALRRAWARLAVEDGRLYHEAGLPLLELKLATDDCLQRGTRWRHWRPPHGGIWVQQPGEGTSRTTSRKTTRRAEPSPVTAPPPATAPPRSQRPGREPAPLLRNEPGASR